MKPDHRRPRVLICDRIAEVGLELLRDHAEVDVRIDLSPQELLNIIGDYEAIVVRSATKVGTEAIERAHNLKVIGRAGSGLDNIDIGAAKKRGIKVVHCPDANTWAVAEHTMALLLALARHLPLAGSTLKQGRWEKSNLADAGLFGKTLGIIGFGQVGREVAIRAQAFGMKILVNQRRPTPELSLEAKVKLVDLAELLQESDFVTLHVPAKAETEGLLSAEQLALMKPTAYLVNTARGSIVNEADLLEALNQGTIAGAALDVFAEAPAIYSELAQHERVVVTSHSFSSSEDALNLAALTIAQQIIDIIQDVPIENPLSLRVVPLEKVLPHEQTDPRRVDRLAARLEAEDILINPPVVVETNDHYVVLDGATRVTAFRQLNIPHLIVQVVSPQDGLNLRTWFHIIRQVNLAHLLKLLAAMPEISMKETDAQHVFNELAEYGGLCYIHTFDDRVFLVQAAPNVSRLHALNKLSETYIAAGLITRTLSCDIASLKNEYPDLTALVVFLEYTVEQVLQIAGAGLVIPAGITRFIIPGRVLRINVPLTLLKSDQPLAEKNQWLRQYVINRLNNGGARYYEEPVYLLDE